MQREDTYYNQISHYLAFTENAFTYVANGI